MDVISIIFLILGIFFIIMISLGLHKDKKEHPERKVDYVFVFIIYLVGVLYILGAFTGYIGIIVFLTTIILPIFIHFYVKKKYPYSDSNMKEKIPKNYMFVLMIYLVGILYILGTVTGYIAVIIFLTVIMLLIFGHLYFKKKHPLL